MRLGRFKPHLSGAMRRQPDPLHECQIIWLSLAPARQPYRSLEDMVNMPTSARTPLLHLPPKLNWR